MKRIGRWLVHAVTLVSLPTPSMCGPKQPFSLTIAQPKKPPRAGAELRLLITVTNTSDRDIGFARSPGSLPEEGFRYEIDVRDAQGHLAPSSASARELRGKTIITQSSNLAYKLKPGESFVDQVTVTTFYDLSQPGQYKISVARPMQPWQNLGKGSVKSDPITVTLTQ